MVTNTCNLSCSYCFGVEQMTPMMKREFMSREIFSALLDWLKRSGLKQFHIMGGEPTRHPDFIWMIELSSKMSFVVDIFSNGITEFSPKEMEMAKRHSRTWIININDPRKYTPIIRTKVERLLAVLGGRAALTFNITDTDYDPAHLFEYINKYGLQRMVKIGIALPTLNKSNVHARPEEFMGLSKSVVNLSSAFKKEDVSAEFECGIPYCFFTEHDRKTLKKNRFNPSSSCCSILDILPDGDVIYCLPMARMLRLSYKEFPTYQDLTTHFEEYYKPYRGIGYKKDCLDCKWKQQCHGSCLARIIPTLFMGKAAI